MLGEHRSSQRGLYQRWLSLADQRLAHLAELYETGRWRRYHTQTQFLENVRESRAAVQVWQRMLDQLDGRDPSEERPLQMADITVTDLVLPRGVHMLPSSEGERAGDAIDMPAARLREEVPAARLRDERTSKALPLIQLSAASLMPKTAMLMPEIVIAPEAHVAASDAVEPAPMQFAASVTDGSQVSPDPADENSVEAAESDAACLAAFQPDQISADAAVVVETQRLPQAKNTVGARADDTVSLIDWTQHHGILIQQRYPILRHV